MLRALLGIFLDQLKERYFKETLINAALFQRTVLGALRQIIFNLITLDPMHSEESQSLAT